MNWMADEYCEEIYTIISTRKGKTEEHMASIFEDELTGSKWVS